jgi:hypothetical protein
MFGSIVNGALICIRQPTPAMKAMPVNVTVPSVLKRTLPDGIVAPPLPGE